VDNNIVHAKTLWVLDRLVSNYEKSFSNNESTSWKNGPHRSFIYLSK